METISKKHGKANGFSSTLRAIALGTGMAVGICSYAASSPLGQRAMTTSLSGQKEAGGDYLSDKIARRLKGEAREVFNAVRYGTEARFMETHNYGPLHYRIDVSLVGEGKAAGRSADELRVSVYSIRRHSGMGYDSIDAIGSAKLRVSQVSLKGLAGVGERVVFNETPHLTMGMSMGMYTLRRFVIVNFGIREENTEDYYMDTQPFMKKNNASMQTLYYFLNRNSFPVDFSGPPFRSTIRYGEEKRAMWAVIDPFSDVNAGKIIGNKAYSLLSESLSPGRSEMRRFSEKIASNEDALPAKAKKILVSMLDNDYAALRKLSGRYGSALKARLSYDQYSGEVSISVTAGISDMAGFERMLIPSQEFLFDGKKYLLLSSFRDRLENGLHMGPYEYKRIEEIMSFRNGRILRSIWLETAPYPFPSIPPHEKYEELQEVLRLAHMRGMVPGGIETIRFSERCSLARLSHRENTWYFVGLDMPVEPKGLLPEVIGKTGAGILAALRRPLQN